jgi:hypothetical protein
MSSCEGIEAWNAALTLKKDYPFLALVGPVGKPTWSDTAVAFASFYHLLAKRISPGLLVDRMNAAAGLEKSEGFMMILAESVNEVVWRGLADAFQESKLGGR